MTTKLIKTVGSALTEVMKAVLQDDSAKCGRVGSSA